MEHSCHQCGATVEDGVAFCAHCNAPQIRVSGLESGFQPGLPGDPHASLAYATTLQWSQALPSAALAGLIAAFLMLIPLGALGLGMIAPGILAVVFYHRRCPGTLLTGTMGAQLGALSGMFGFGMFAIFTAIETFVFRSGGQLRSALLEAVQQSAARNPDPQAQQILDYLKTPTGLAVVMALGLVVMLVLFLVLSSASGALGAAWLRRKGRY